MRVREAFARTALSSVVEYDVFREHCPTARVVLKRESERVFRTGQEALGFAFLVSGRVKLVTVRDDGRESILDFIEHGTAVCPAKPHACEPYCCDAVASEAATRVLVLSRSEALELTRRVPAVMGMFVRMVSERAVRMCARVGELSAGSAEQRISALFLGLTRLSSPSENGTLRVELPLSRRDLAQMTSMRVETATRAVRRLEKAGVLTTHRWGFEVLDPDRLRSAAAGGAVGNHATRG